MTQTAAIPRFGGWAALYALYRPAYPAALIERLARAMRSRQKCIELGAGTGQATEALLALFDRVAAVEPDSAMAAHIARHPRLRVMEDTAEDVDFAAHSADAVTAFTALHWMDVEQVAAKATHWLRPGGVFFACGLAPVQFPGAPPAAGAVLRAYGRRFRGHMHHRLSSWEGAVQLLQAHQALESFDRFEIYADYVWSPRQAAGFMMTTSFGQAFAQATGDANLAFETMADDLHAATGGRKLLARVPIEGVTARRRA